MKMPRCWTNHPWACTVPLLLVLLAIPLGMSAYHSEQSTGPFEIRVVDSQTGAGVPGLRVTADNGIFCFTRSDGSVSFGEDSLMNHSVYFKIEGQDHHFAGGGKTIRVVHGGHAKLKVSR